ncbi:hypothetical protein DM558_13980 [Entomomonas moraniae]|uniref:SPOR domain-containing protein n=1 Tax=Entomomonas moraniae TaxID=2213226 RepID=A0A451EPR6_9GAMM|nr:hypothetical protein [Entomomonas moraniae]AZS51805.1 hypothetical protein DM558_13980 [Entomomonas moraniae]
MRWLFVFLVFLNLFFYVWQKQQTTTVPQKIAVEPEQIPTIQLVKEHPELTKPHRVEQSVEQITETPNTPKEPIICLYIGGFTNPDQLTVISSYIKKIDPNIKLDVVKPDTIPTVELYVATTSTEQLQTLEQLDKLSINSLIILRGVLKDDISLGLFSNEEDYADIKKALANTNIAIKINKLPKSATSHWLQIPNSQYSLFTHEQLLTLVKRFPTAQQALMPCSATAKNLN